MLLTVDDLTERLRVSRATVYRLVERRQLPFHRLPGRLRFTVSDVDAFLARRRVGTMDEHDVL